MDRTETCTLYGSQGSGSAAVEAALRLCGLAFTAVRASTWEPDSALDALGQVNPLRQIPTLVLPGGQVLTESAAILIHLGLQHPSSGLLPRDGQAQAQAIRGLVFIAANCYSAISILDYPERWTSASSKASHEALRRGARARLHQHWDIFADQFLQQPFLSGEAPGALDLLASVVSRWAGSRAHLKASRPEFFALLQRIDQHPTLLPVWLAHWP